MWIWWHSKQWYLEKFKTETLILCEQMQRLFHLQHRFKGITRVIIGVGQVVQAALAVILDLPQVVLWYILDCKYKVSYAHCWAYNDAIMWYSVCVKPISYIFVIADSDSDSSSESGSDAGSPRTWLLFSFPF